MPIINALVVSGTPASVKSALASALAQTLSWPLLDDADLATTLISSTLKAVTGDSSDLTHDFYTRVLSPAMNAALVRQSNRLLDLNLHPVVAISDTKHFLPALELDPTSLLLVQLNPSSEKPTPFSTLLLDHTLPLPYLVAAVRQHCQPATSPHKSPKALVLCGLPGVGKSAVADLFARQTGWALIDGSDITATISSAVLQDREGNPAAITSDLYEQSIRVPRVTAITAQCARMLSAGYPLISTIADGLTFADQWSHALSPIYVELITDENQRKYRLARRGKPFDPHLLELGKSRSSALWQAPSKALVLESSGPLNAVVNRLINLASK